jgi:hypothetical protein
MFPFHPLLFTNNNILNFFGAVYFFKFKIPGVVVNNNFITFFSLFTLTVFTAKNARNFQIVNPKILENN